ncbi:MAG: hypothetical protein V4629_09415 [Pseudomonadota bacterium]
MCVDFLAAQLPPSNNAANVSAKNTVEAPTSNSLLKKILCAGVATLAFQQSISPARYLRNHPTKDLKTPVLTCRLSHVVLNTSNRVSLLENRISDLVKDFFIQENLPLPDNFSIEFNKKTVF